MIKAAATGLHDARFFVRQIDLVAVFGSRLWGSRWLAARLLIMAGKFPAPWGDPLVLVESADKPGFLVAYQAFVC